MINGTNLLGKHNPRWTDGNVTETNNLLAVLPAYLTAPPRRRFRLKIRFPGSHSFDAARGAVSNWLASLPRQAGSRLFARNDDEAHWRNWHITQLRHGLTRSYRDIRFDVLSQLHDLAEHRTGQFCGDASDGSDNPRP